SKWKYWNRPKIENRYSKYPEYYKNRGENNCSNSHFANFSLDQRRDDVPRVNVYCDKSTQYVPLQFRQGPAHQGSQIIQVDKRFLLKRQQGVSNRRLVGEDTMDLSCPHNLRNGQDQLKN
ncbi:unnamed protein product, partial [Nesidiocoris tenuis]